MLNKNNLIIYSLVDKASRKQFKGIYVNERETMTTNGAALIVIDKPKIDSTEWPELPGCEKDNEKDKYIIPFDTAKEVIANIPKDGYIRKTYTILSGVAEHSNNGTVELITTDLQTTKKAIIHREDSSVPNYRGIIEDRDKKQPVATFGMDANLLGKICDIIKKTTQLGWMRFYIYDDHETCGTKITACNSDTEQKITAVIMPLRINDDV